MQIHRFLIAGVLLIVLMGAISAADNTSQDDIIMASNTSDTLVALSSSEENSYISVQENNDVDSTLSISINDSESLKASESDFKISNGNENNQANSYDNQYYLFRGDCWTINNNFESSAAVTSESYSDLTVTGTFRTLNDIIGLYWNSQDPIQHPYISYGNRSDYTDVILEFNYEMNGCTDFSNGLISITIAANTGETYFLTMSQFIENGHVKLDFNNLTLLPGDSYVDRNGQPVIVSEETKLNVTDLKYLMFSLLPTNFVQSNSEYTIMENAEFSCKISNITVTNGEICTEQSPLEPHQYRLCEGYDDSYNLNPYRISREMRKLGYVDWVDLYIGASYFYEKRGNISDVIEDLNFNNNRTGKMVLDKNVPLNNAFRAWLDCYSRELKNNGVENLIISVSMENLQCPESWRQMDYSGDFAVTGWEPSTYFYSPCNDEVIEYLQNVSESCLDIVVGNSLRPILQMGEAWWWWNENELPDQSPCFYDNTTKEKYLAEHGTALPEYISSWTTDYNETTVNWLNQQLVRYSDALREVVKSNKYNDGLYMALFFPPSVTDSERVPPMIRDANYLVDAYSPAKLDILQIEDYDWVIFENPHHSEAYTIGQELGFSEDQLHYFGGFVQYPEDASRYWPLIEKSMDDAIEQNFKEVFVWAGSQVRRDSKILGYDEYVIIGNLKLNNEPGNLTPTITTVEYASTGENFTVKMSTDKWVSGVFKVYEYEDCEIGKLLASSTITNGSSSASVSSSKIGLNKFYLEFVYDNGIFHLFKEVYIIENSKNITANVSSEIETGSDATITFNAPESPSAYVYITIDDNETESYLVENGEFTKTVSNLADGYHTVLINYNEGSYIDNKLVGEVYYKNFKVKVGVKTHIETQDVTTDYNSGENLSVILKDSENNLLAGKNITITLNGINHTVTTDNNGQATWTIDVLPGNYTAEIFYAEEGVYLSSSASAEVVVNKLVTYITSNNITATYGDSVNLTITLKDMRNNLLVGKDVLILFDGFNYTIATNNNGQVILPIQLMPSNYTVRLEYAEDEIYLSSSTNAHIAINKIATGITSEDIAFIYGDPKNLTVTLKDNENKALSDKEIIITIDGENQTATTNSNGQATLLIETLPGNYTAKITFKEDSLYLSSSTEAEVKIDKIATNLTSEDISFIYGDTENLTITLKDMRNNLLAGKDILIIFDGFNYTIATNNNGQVILPIQLLPANYTVRLEYAEDSVYLSSSAEAQIAVNKIPTNITSEDISFIYGNQTNLTVALKDMRNNDLADKEIIITLDGHDYTVTTDSNGKAALPVEILPGNYTAEISFKEDSLYLSSSTDAEVKIDKIATNLTSEDISFIYGEPTNLTITLKDMRNNLLVGKDILILFDSFNYTIATNENGQVLLPIQLLPANYTVRLEYAEDSVYLSSSASVDIIVNKIPTNLTADNVSFIYEDATNLTVVLKDMRNETLTGKEIIITLDGKNHTVSTDENGKATLPIESLPGNYTAEIRFKEDTLYLSSSTDADVTVNKIATDLAADNVSFIYGDPTNLTVALKDMRDKNLTGKEIMIKLDGHNYTVTTDSNGQATLPIESLPGNYTAEISFKEDTLYLSSSANADVSVNKIATDLTTDDITFIYGDSTNLTVTLKDMRNNLLKDKEVIIALDGINHTVTTNSNGQATLPIESLPGNYTAEISFKEDTLYLSSSASADVIINKIATDLTAENITFIYGNPTNLTITLKDMRRNALKGKEIIVTLDDLNYTVTTNSNGEAALPIEILPGNYTAKITFKEDTLYLSSSASADVTIDKIATNLTAEDITFIYGEPTNLTVTLKDMKNNLLQGKDLIVTLDGINYSVTTDSNGKATLPIEILPGNYTAEITFKEDTLYLSTSTDAEIIIEKITTDLTADDITFIYGDPTNLTVTLKDMRNKLLADKEITVTLDGNNYTVTTNKNGRATLPIEILPGNYTAKITFKEDRVYLPSATDAEIIIDKIATELTAENIRFIYGNQTNLTVTLKDMRNNPLEGKDIIITLDGINHTVNTDSTGKATLPIEILPGNYTAKITFKEDNIYLPSTTEAEIFIEKITTDLTADDITFIYGDPTNLTVTLKDMRNKLLADKEITITLDGNNYTVTTNKNGQATLPIEILPGNYTAKITFKEDNVYLPSATEADIIIEKIATSLTADDITFIYGDSTNLTVTLKDMRDNHLEGKDIIIYIDGSNYTITTSSKGEAALPIEILPGNYTAKIYYKEDEIYLSSSTNADVIIDKIVTDLTAEDITFIYGEPTNLTVTIKDMRNNPLKDKEIIITLDGENHTVTTNSNGQATLPIEILPGNYTAKITFKEDTLYLSSSTDAEIIIDKISTELTANDISFIYGEPTNLTVALKDMRNNDLADKEIIIELDNINYTVSTNENGQATLPIGILPGNYTAKITFKEDTLYLSSTTDAEITINKIATDLTANDISFIYGNQTDLVIILKDMRNKALNDKKIIITLDGQKHTLTTDNNGQATLPIELLPGNYTAEISYNEDEIYLSSSTDADITIGKIATDLTANDISFIYGETANLTATLKDMRNNLLTDKEIIITLDGYNYTVTTDSNGKATLPIEILPGNYTAKITFKEDTLYLSSSTDAKVIIDKIATELTANDVSFTYGDQTDLVITLKDMRNNPLKDKEIIITLDGQKHTVTTDNNGQATLPIELLPRNYTAEISYNEDEIYLSSSTDADIIIGKIATDLTANDISFTYGEPTNLTVSLKDMKNNPLAGKDISISLDGIIHSLTTDDNGKATLPIELLPGTYTAEISYKEDKVYLSSSANAKIIIEKIATELTTADISFTYGEPTNLTITLKDMRNNPLRGKEIIITLDGIAHSVTTDDNGKATLPIDLLPGTYIAEISFNEDKVYLSSSANAKIIIEKIATELTANDISFIYGEPTNLAITLKDMRNNPLKDKEIIITLDGQKHTVTTNKSGQTTLPIDLLPGTYTSEISFNEDKVYLSSSANAKIIIDKISTELTANDVSFIYGNQTNLVIALKDMKNNALPGKDVSITLNGLDLTVTTDNNGKAALPIDLLPGNYTAEITFNEDKVYLSSSAKANIIIDKVKTDMTVNDISFTYGDSANLVITLKDMKNNALPGKDVSINLNGITHTLTTDNNGQVTLPIDLLPGNYTSEAYFSEDNVYLSSSASADVIVNKIATELTANDISFIYGEQADLVITLKDMGSNTLKDKDVSIKLNGMSHTLKTDNYGQISLPIDLLPGNYAAEISYAGDNVYLPSSDKANVLIAKVTTRLTADNISFIYGSPTDLVIGLKDSEDNVLEGKEVLITINLTDGTSTYRKTTDSKGIVSLAIDYDAGSYAAVISYAGDEIYVASSATSNIVISKLATQIIASDVILNLTNKGDLVATLKDENGNALSGFDLIISLAGNEFTKTTDDLGQVDLSLNLDVGSYTANILFMGAQNYAGTNKNVKITVLDKVATQLYAPNITSTYGTGKNLVITLKDENGHALAGKEITININNKLYTKTTDENGQANLYVKLAVKKYDAQIEFAGDGRYKSSSYTAKVTFQKSTPKLTASSKVFMTFVKNKKVTATLKNKNKAVKNAKVKLTVNKKTYTVKTNSKGVATFKVKITKKGTFKAVYKFAGNSNLKSATKKVKIIIK